jgi:integrase
MSRPAKSGGGTADTARPLANGKDVSDDEQSVSTQPGGWGMSRHPGIEVRKGPRGTRYMATVSDRKTGKRQRKTFTTLREAQAWRQDRQVAIGRGTARAATRDTVESMSNKFIDDLYAGRARARGGKPYKPSSIRAMEQNLRLRVIPVLGRMRFAEVTRGDVQALVDDLYAQGAAPSTIQTTLLPLQVMFRRALQRDLIAVNPTMGIEKPSVEKPEVNCVTVAEADALLAELEGEVRQVWSTALWSGLRRGELKALQVGDVDLARGEIRVKRNWDEVEGEVAPKGGKPRTVPVTPDLRDVLDARILDLRMQYGDSADDRRLFGPSVVRQAYDTAKSAWAEAGLQGITLHEARHTFASTMIAAGVNAKALCDFMGHSSIKVTFDRYGHLFPGATDEAAQLAAAFMAREREVARKAGATVLPEDDLPLVMPLERSRA